MAIGTRVWSIGRVLLLACALITTYLGFAVMAARIAVRAREVRVPALTKHTPGDAGALLAEVGLTLRVDPGRKPDRTVPSGHIVAQDPAAGTIARRGRSVKVWVSAGDLSARVPSLVGESERSATLRLQQIGLASPVISEVASGEFPSGVVVAQDPPPGGHGPRSSLLVNRGERPRAYLMPDLIGVSGEQAAGLLRAAGFRVALVDQQPYPGVPPGLVVRQTPPCGFQVAPGQTISLEVTR